MLFAYPLAKDILPNFSTQLHFSLLFFLAHSLIYMFGRLFFSFSAPFLLNLFEKRCQAQAQH